jgi:hypothetical protein
MLWKVPTKARALSDSNTQIRSTEQAEDGVVGTFVDPG